MTIEEFRAKKQNILNSSPVKNSNNEMSIDEFRKKKQQILSGVTEQSKTQETVDEQVSAPQTIKQKMDALWEEEKQPVSNQQSTATNQAHQDDYRSRMNNTRKATLQKEISELENKMKGLDKVIRGIYSAEEKENAQKEYSEYKKQYNAKKDELKTLEPKVQLNIDETNLENNNVKFSGAPLDSGVLGKVASFVNKTVPETAGKVIDTVKEPFVEPSLSKLMTEAKLSPQLLADDAKIQLQDENPSRYDYALVKPTKEAVEKYGMEDSNIKAINGDNTKLLEDLESAEKTWQVSPVDAAATNALAAGASIFGNLGSLANSLGADQIPVLKEITNFAVEGARKAQENAQQYNRGSYGEALGTVTQGVVNLVPYFLLGTGTTAVKGATAVTKYAKYIEPIIKNPSFWYSLTSMWGQKYQEKIDEGYNRFEALGNAIIYALPSALIEIGGGIGAKGKEAQSLLITMGEEIGEEIAQDIISGASDKLVTNHDMPIFSMTEDAVFNPVKIGKTVLYTTPIAGIGGGVGKTINNMQNANAKKQQTQNNVENYKTNSEYAKYIPTNQTADNNIKISNTTLDNVVNTQKLLSGINENIKNNQSVGIKNKTTEEIKSEYEKLVPTQKNDVSQAPQSELNNTGNQIIPSEIQTAQNGNMEQTAQNDKVMDTLLGKKVENVNNIAKNEVFSYTNSRGDINGEQEINQGRNQTNFEETKNERNYETNSERNSNINESKIRIAEQARKQIILPQTDIESQIFQKAKELGMNVYLYEKGSDEFDGFSAKDGVYIDKAGKEREEVLFSHELLHNLRQNKNPIFDSEIKPLIDELGESAEFINVFDKFNSTLQEEIPLEQLAEAKEVMLEEIFADYTAKILANYDIDYNISNDMYNKLEKSLLKITQPFNISAGKEPVFSLPKTDNQGRNLTVNQQEFFKDSKVRDKKGNLEAMYHGTRSNKFEVFDITKAGRTGKILGEGFYFFNNKEAAKLYSGSNGTIFETYLNIKNPLELEDGLGDAKIKEYKAQAEKQQVSLRDYLKSLGYDGVHADDVYVAFEPNQIKNIDNAKPTESEAINLFASSEAPRPYMELNKYISTNKDSEANKVSLTDIQKAINDIVTVKTGKFRQQAYGIYKNQSEIIRLKQQKDIPVALHELTHHLDKKYNLSSSDKISNELKKIAVVGKNATEQTKIKEGVAEFGRYYMTNKEYAKEIAPFYYDAFETALDGDPAMKGKVEAIRQMVSDYLEQSPLNRFLSNIDKGDNEVSLWDNVKNKLIEAKRSFRKNFVDDLDPLKEIIEDITNGEKLSVNEDAHKLLRLNKGVTGRVRVALEYGIVDSNGNKIGKGLKEIIEPVADDIDGFIAYISALRANDLQEKGIETGFNKKDIDAVLKMYEGKKTFENASKELYKFQNQILEKTLIQSGIITKEAMEAYNKNNPHYVPFYRVMDDNFKKSKDSMSKVPKKIKGSTRDIINPLESIIKNTYSYMQLAEKNNAHKALFNLANKFDGTGKWFDQVPTDMVGTKITAADVKDILEQLNLDEDVDYNEVFTTIFKPVNNQKGNIVTVMDNGKPIHYEINDKELYDILTSANSSKEGNWILQAMNKGATVLRVGATHSMEFILRNPIRDTIDAGIYSKNDFIPFVDTIAGIFEIAGRSDLYYKWLESGASGSTYTNAQRKALRNTLEELIPQVTDSKKNKIVDILANTAKHPLRTYLNVAGNISNIMEEGTRVGEFKKALKNTENLKESALESRSITVDFSRGGKQAKELNKYVAFLNAEIQGLDKMFSSFHDRPVATTLKAFVGLTIPSMLIRALQDDDEMDKVPQWEKDTYWVFFVGNTPIKIPKPQGLGQLFATAPERLVDFLKTQDKDAFDGLVQRLITSYMPLDSATSLLPTAWQPFIENATNYSFFRQQPIVKQSLQNRSPKYQYDENTSTIAKTVGGALNVSPKKIDNLISGYGGNLGKDIANIAGMPIDMVNILVNGGKKEKEYSTFNSTLRKIPLVKGFVASDTASKELDKFYEEKSKINTLYTDTKFKYSGIKLNNAQEKELAEIQELNRMYNSAYNDIKKINEQIDEVEKSNMSNKYKESKINKLEEEIEKVALNLEKESKKLKESILTYK